MTATYPDTSSGKLRNWAVSPAVTTYRRILVLELRTNGINTAVLSSLGMPLEVSNRFSCVAPGKIEVILLIEESQGTSTKLNKKE